MNQSSKTDKEQLKFKRTMTIADIQYELGVSRKVATAWAQQYLHYKRIGRQYIFSRKEFTEVIEAQTDVIYEVRY